MRRTGLPGEVASVVGKAASGKRRIRAGEFLYRAGTPFHSVYVVRAVKRTHGMRLITPKWRQERARRRALAPIPQKSHKNYKSNGKG